METFKLTFPFFPLLSLSFVFFFLSFSRWFDREYWAGGVLQHGIQDWTEMNETGGSPNAIERRKLGDLSHDGQIPIEAYINH